MPRRYLGRSRLGGANLADYVGDARGVGQRRRAQGFDQSRGVGGRGFAAVDPGHARLARRRAWQGEARGLVCRLQDGVRFGLLGQCGDGITSAINFKLDLGRTTHDGAEHVVITFDGKFLPHNWPSD